MRPVLLCTVVMASALVAGCDFCEPGELRCNGHVVESCSDTRNWEEEHDCGSSTCAVGADACAPWLDLGFGETWCCIRPASP